MFELGVELDTYSVCVSVFHLSYICRHVGDIPKMGFSSWAMPAYSEFLVAPITTKPYSKAQ